MPDLLFPLLAPGQNPLGGLEQTALPQAPPPPSLEENLGAPIDWGAAARRVGAEAFDLTTRAGEAVERSGAMYGGDLPPLFSDPSAIPAMGPGAVTHFAPEPRVDVQTAKQRYPDVQGIDEPLPDSVLRNMQEQQQREKVRQDILANYPAGYGNAVVGLGSDFVASLLDPVQDAAFMVPVVGESRYAAWLASAGERAGLLGRFAVTAGVGGARGALGGALLGGAEVALDPDASLSDVAQQTLWTAAQGAVLHTGFGFRGDVLGQRFIESAEGDLAAHDAALHDAATRAAAAQMADGQPIEVRPVFEAAQLAQQRAEAARQVREGLEVTTALGRVPEASYLDQAVSRAAGEPSAEAAQWADTAAEARANPPDKVFAGQMAEAQGVIEQLRQQGLLTPEDEAELALHEQLAQPPAPVAPAEAVQVAHELFGVQAAAARGETLRAGVPQEAPGGLFAPHEPGQEDIPFQRGRAIAQRLVEVARQPGPQFTGTDLEPGEAAERVARAEAEAARIAPGATVQPVATLRAEGEPVSGAYFPTTASGLRHVIAWSLESPDEVGTVRHEAVHFLKRAGYITDSEWQTLADSAEQKGWLGLHDIEQRYPGLDREGQVEEAVAEHYAEWNRGSATVPSIIRPIFEAIRSTMRTLGDFLRRTFGANATADDIFQRIESGEVGGRQPTQPEIDQAAFQREAFSEDEFDEAAAARKQLTAMQDIAKRQALAQKIDGIHAAGLPIARGYDAEIRGINHAVSGARDSSAALQLNRRNEFVGRLTGNLDRVPGAMAAWRGHTLTAEWVQELAELRKDDGQPGISKSPMALQIAKAVQDAQDIARLRLNQSGAWVGDYEGYVSRTQHDAVAIHKAGYQQWHDDVLGWLNRDKTFAGLTPEAQEGFLRNMWDALSTGVHMSADHGIGPKAGVFPGGANIGKRVSAERVLHWRDPAADWRSYQMRYGEPNIELGVLNNLTRAGRDAALMERWGSNPKAAFDEVVRRTRERYRTDHDALADFDRNLPRITEEFAHLTGEASRPTKELGWQVTRGSLMALQDITKLGNVLLAHMSVGVTKPYQLQYHGIGRWQAYTSVLRNLIQDTSPAGREVMENLRANATGQMTDLAGYEAVDSVPGAVAALRQFSMRIGGLPWMIGRAKSGAQWELSNFLGHQVGKTFDQLHPNTQRALSIYDIGPQEWDALRTAPDHDRDGAGSLYLTPAAASRANVDSLVGPRLDRALDEDDANRMRAETADRLAMKLASYLSDSAERSTVTPGIPERAFFSRYVGRYAGPVVGQYKVWAMAAVRQMWGQAIFGSSKAEAVKSLAELVAVGTAIGYARMALTSGLQGQTPQLFNGDPKHDMILMAQSMVAGGGAGIWGDYLMGQYSRPGERGTDYAKDFALNVLGPAATDAANIYGIGHEAVVGAFSDDPTGQMEKTGADMMHFLTTHLPIVNVWYLHLLSHWLFIDRLNEMADPGYNQRRQQAIQERTGQQTWLQPAYAGAQQ